MDKRGHETVIMVYIEKEHLYIKRTLYSVEDMKQWIEDYEAINREYDPWIKRPFEMSKEELDSRCWNCGISYRDYMEKNMLEVSEGPMEHEPVRFLRLLNVNGGSLNKPLCSWKCLLLSFKSGTE